MPATGYYRPWVRTGQARVAPWWFGLMRAEVEERRDWVDTQHEPGEVTGFQTRWVGAGRLPPWESGPGYYSLLAARRHPVPHWVWPRFVTPLPLPVEARGPHPSSEAAPPQ